MTDPLIALPEVENEGARAFHAGRHLKTHALWYGFAFCPYAIGSTLRDNWVKGYGEAFDGVSPE